MAQSRRHPRGHGSIDVVCHKCSFCFRVEISGRRQEVDCPRCGVFAGEVDPEGGLVVRCVCRRCGLGYPVDVSARTGAFTCPGCGGDVKLSDRALLRKLEEVWRLRKSQRESEPDELGHVDLDEMEIDGDLLARVPRSLAFAYACVPIRFENGVLTVAVSKSRKAGALEDLAFILGWKVAGAVVPAAALERALRRFYGGGAEDG